jgi:hypothetical protein
MRSVEDFVDTAIEGAMRDPCWARIVLGVREPNVAGEATIEVLLIGLDNPERSHSLIAELGALHHREVIRVVDSLVINREPDGTISASARTPLSSDEAEQFRHLMHDAIGLQPDSGGFGPGLSWQGGSVLLGPTDARSIAESLGPGRAALAVVFEHRWARELGKLVHARGVTLLEDDVLTPELLAGAGRGTA